MTAAKIELTQEEKRQALLFYGISNIKQASQYTLCSNYEIVLAESTGAMETGETATDPKIIERINQRLSKYQFVHDCIEAEAKRRGLTL